MSCLERIKQHSNLPNFGILSKTKLYLPNANIQHNILGKWSLDWIDSDRCVIGFVEQDQSQNITFEITGCYEIMNDNLTLINKSDFLLYWSGVFTYDPFLSIINITISDSYLKSDIKENNTFEPMKNILSGNRLGEKTNPKPLIIENSKEESRPVKIKSPKPVFVEAKKVKEKVIDLPTNSYQVCKTDKPDVYHVFQNKKYISTCLIPNMKTSRYMQELFEHKQIDEMVSMDMKLHINTNRYYPNL